MHAVDRPASPIYYMHYFLARPASCCLLRQMDRLLGSWLPHVGSLSGCWNTSMEPDKKPSARRASIYYSPRGYWKGLSAIKKLAPAAKVTERQAKEWLKKQAIWQIYLPAQRHIPQPKFDVAVPNEVHQADLLFLLHDPIRQNTFRYALTPSWPQRAKCPFGGRRSLSLPVR